VGQNFARRAGSARLAAQNVRIAARLHGAAGASNVEQLAIERVGFQLRLSAQ
jgi:hypothetical protein